MNAYVIALPGAATILMQVMAIIGFLHRRREESGPFSLSNPAAYRGILPIVGTRLWDGATPTQIAGSA